MFPASSYSSVMNLAPPAMAHRDSTLALTPFIRGQNLIMFARYLTPAIVIRREEQIYIFQDALQAHIIRKHPNHSRSSSTTGALPGTDIDIVRGVRSLVPCAAPSS
jgi:hypothetical protein